MRPARYFVGFLAMAAACGGGSSSQNGFANAEAGAGDGSGSGGDDGGSLVGDDAATFPDGGSSMHDAAPPPQVSLVYAHSADTLYRLDPTSKQVAVVGPFTGGCSSVIDLAIDSSSSAYVTTPGSLYRLDLKSAACTHVSDGNYPNSLSFVPKGTLDPSAEALVGYFGSTYVRIDTTSGAVTNIGALTGGYQSSGDIVSVIGGGTFLTVNGTGACADCLLQIDPKTGNLIQNYGSVNHSQVFGLAFWAGAAYGFDNAGEIFSIGWQNNKLVTTNIPIPNPPPGLSFWGAGSTTSAPPTTADGGGIPIQ